jgi:hypothetical protein
VIVFWEIFLEYFWIILGKIFKKSLKFLKKTFIIFIKVYVKKIGQKCHLKNELNPFTSPFIA